MSQKNSKKLAGYSFFTNWKTLKELLNNLEQGKKY